MTKEKKAFKDTLFGKIINKAAHVIPDAVGIGLQAATGDVSEALNTLKDKLLVASADGSIKAKDVLTELDLKWKEIELEFRKYDIEELSIKEENSTKRWEADMHSDSWMSKNARPIALFWALTMATAIIVSSWLNAKTPEQVLYMYSGIATSIVGGYFVLRTVEKRNQKKYK